MLGSSLRETIFTSISRRIFYGWAILVVAGLGIFAGGPGQSHSFSVFIGPIGEDLGISNAAIASAYGLATLGAAFCLPAMGRLIDRFGPRRMLLANVSVLGLACLLFGAAANFLWLAVGFAAVRFLGQGSLMLNCANLVSHWFQRRRGFALSLMALGFAASMAIHPPLGQYLVETMGWRIAWVVLGILSWTLMLPPVLLLVHDKPEDKGLRPDATPRDAYPADAPEPQLGGLTLAQALRTSVFYILAAGSFAISMLVTTLHFYQVSILEAQGVAADVAARVFPISAITMVATIPLVGQAFDHFRTRFVFATGLLVTAASLVAVTFVDDLVTAVLYGMLFGLNNAFSMTTFGYVWPRYFGRRHLGSIQGTGQMIGVVGASVGPLPVGLAFDLLGSATGTLHLLTMIPLGCAAAAMALRTPAKVPVTSQLE